MRPLRSQITTDLFDYATLTGALADYRNVRGKINRLLASGEVIRIKKGLYTFPDYLRRQPLNECVIANMIYGPSYVSEEFALAHYGMIPETVVQITSITRRRPAMFETPVGRFSYDSRLADDYPVGVCSENSALGGFLIATPEKALYDKAAEDRRLTGDDDLQQYFLDDLRVDSDELRNLNVEILNELESVARGRMKRVVKFLREYQR